nr:centrosome-associated zinc finger protein CP190 [Bactrocera oleae]XP_036233129.1 centrosome-associated zinc finger protein CP190 [Bactrocera oleae]XP_036233130.1 centrosome-associated zinc finger protein CP190 [Bactrocera oleae]XP_036233131.1 centrosome-associated zinc finger protein CP190 [Bactrocera oleae]
MGEIKSVKVDNWGVFFLQKLQNFFNKTDYCDLTLQFRDNSQLKVHRLVLSACTDYFNVLEQTCEMVDDALIMPNELQADVVVPIVNFMYTGTLEFELKMYGKLLRTAKDMNMTVLLKLLEAHRRTMEGVNRMQRPPSPKPLRRRVPVAGILPSQQPGVQQRRILTSPNSVSGVQRRIATKSVSTNASSSTPATAQSQYRQQIGSTSLIKTNNGNNSNTSQSRTQFANQSMQESHQTTIKQEPEEPSVTSPFEQLRKGYNNNKRPASNTLISPPTKKLNIEDVKEFAEQQRMRKQIAAEYGDDQGEYENSMMEDDIHNDDDDDDLATSSATATSAAMQPSTSRQTQLKHGATTITINQNEKPPTIVVKDSSNSKMNHAKIIKEVLRQYPHLVKSNKNIKLKIMPSSGDQPQKIIVKKEQLESITSNAQSQSSSPSQSVLRGQASSQTLLKPMEKSQNNVNQTVSQQPALPKVSPPTTSAKPINVSVGNVAMSSAAPAQKRRIDSKTMHALIALGAENTTGPWLCLRCGVNGRPISIPSYRGFRRHLINTHKEQIDPALCEHCGCRSSTKRELHFHMEVEHKVKTTSYTFPQCLLCSNAFLDTNALNKHMVEAHPDENKQQCIYCNKIFARELQLYNHMKTYHKKQALEDGIIDYSDEEFSESQDAGEVIRAPDITSKEKKESKIKIISDISLPSAGTIINMESSNMSSGINAQVGIIGEQQEFMETNESSVIASEPKFVTVDGNEMVLTDEQRQEIMAQLNQDHGTGGVVMVLNEPTEYAAETTAISDHLPNLESGSGEKEQVTQEPNLEVEPEHEDEAMDEGIGNAAAENSTAVEEFDDSLIYRELTDTQNTHDEEAEGTSDVISATASNDDKRNTSGGGALDESKESIENLEWAENLISAHEMADQEIEAKKHVKENKDADAINQKLKELTGDWSEDENDEEQEVAAATPNSEVDATEESSAVVENILEEKNNPIESKQKQTMEENVEVAANVDNKSMEQDTADTESDIAGTREDNAIIQDDNPTYTNVNVDDAKGDEDDLDMLMKNLHKEDTDATEIEGEEKENEDQKMDERPVEDLEVATQNEDIAASSKDATAIESGNISQEESKTDNTIIAGVASDGSLQLDMLEELNIKEEFISESSSAEAKVAKASSVDPSEPSTTEVKSTESIGTTEVNEDTDADGVTEEMPDNRVERDKDNSKTVEETIKDVLPETSEANKDNVESIKTSERLSSLISEWGEDEEEDEQTAAPPAAPITTEEEGTL